VAAIPFCSSRGVLVEIVITRAIIATTTSGRPGQQPIVQRLVMTEKMVASLVTNLPPTIVDQNISTIGDRALETGTSD
jgi:hypothetical protein